MLKYLIDSLDGLEEPIKALYKDAGDGKFVLDAEGLPDVDGLKKNRDDILKENKKLAEKIKAAEDKAAEETRRAAKEQEERLKKEGDVKGLDESWNKKHTEKILEITAEKDASIKERDAMIEDLTVNSDARKIASEITLPGSAEVLIPHLQKRLRVDIVDGKPKSVVVDSSGNRTAQTLDDLKKEFISNPAFAPLVAGSRASGAGLPNNNANGGAVCNKKMEEYSGAELVKMRKENPTEYDRVIKERNKPKKK